MAQQITQSPKNVLRKDFLFAGSMLIVCCVFVAGLMIVPFWEDEQTQQVLSANATSTAFAVATQQAPVTTTAIARITEQAQYEFMDSFTDNSRHWPTGPINSDYMSGSVKLNGAYYVWDIREVKDTAAHWENFPGGRWFEDFDVYADSKVKTVDGTSTSICSGFVFRTASYDWEKGGYIFSVCNNSYFEVEYYEQGEWEDISGWTFSSAIQNSDWNRLGISARGDRFTFTINNELVYEMTDNRLLKGGLALYADINEEKPVSILFDNVGFQPR